MNPALLPRALTLGFAALMAILPAGAQTTLDKVSFGTNWVPEAEQGGFFQAVADGTYQRYGLDVTIVPGRSRKCRASGCRSSRGEGAGKSSSGMFL